MIIRLTRWIAIVLLCGLPALAQAAPPTVVPSPGYDARLREQRAATAVTPLTPGNPPVTTPRHRKRKHAH